LHEGHLRNGAQQQLPTPAMEHVNGDVRDQGEPDPTPLHVADFAPDAVEPGVLQDPNHAHQRKQIGDGDDGPRSELVGALNRPQFGCLSAQSNPIIPPLIEDAMTDQLPSLCGVLCQEAKERRFLRNGILQKCRRLACNGRVISITCHTEQGSLLWGPTF
jgi:hypothetical protein